MVVGPAGSESCCELHPMVIDKAAVARKNKLADGWNRVIVKYTLFYRRLFLAYLRL